MVFWVWWIFVAALVSVVKSNEDVRDIRLPRHFVPRHYALHLLPNVHDQSANATVEGFVQIDVQCLENTRQIVLHAVDIQVNLESIKVYDRASRERFFVQNMTEDTENQFLILHVRRKDLVKGANYVIAMRFTSLLRGQDRPRGFYRIKYMEDGQPSMMALTQMEPIHARQVFPCFDEPNLKADFTITVGRPVNMISVSNMPKHKTIPAEEHPGYEWDLFHRSFPMPTYIVSVAILNRSPWLTLPNKNISLSIWARPSLLNQTKYSLKVASKMIDFYQSYLKVNYPLPKQDMIAAPNLNSAMENWGLIIYGEHMLTHDQDATSKSEKELNTVVMAHEIAHQWFGNLVTLDWWSDIWLNEGLATYLSYIGVDQVFPKYKMMQQFVLNEMQQVMQSDALDSSHAVYMPTEHTEQILWIFDPISYKKGASLLRMLAEFLGQKTFRQGLNRYLRTLEYKNAVQDDLWSALTAQAESNKVTLPFDIKYIMETWTHNVGYPVVTVTRNYSAGTASAVQERFMLHAKRETAENVNLWFIPLSYMSASDRETKTLWMLPLSRPENITNITNVTADQWIIFNIDRTGFYRVNYDDRNWDLIWAQLLHDPTLISTLTRAQLIDDAFNLARADQLSYRTAFQLANYLRKETKYVPWKSAFDVFEYIDTMLVRTPTYEAFKNFMIGITTPMYDKVTFSERAGDDLLTLRLRVEAVKWACYWNHNDCLNKSIALYKKWMTQPDTKIVPADLKRTITCTAVRNLGVPEWQFAWTKFQESNIHTEKSDLLSGMGCSTNATLLITMLNWTLDSAKLADIYFYDVFTSISSASVQGKLISYDFIKSNWNTLKNSHGLVGERISKALDSVTSSFNNLADLEELNSLKAEKGADDSVAGSLIAYVSHKIEANILWMSKNYGVIDELLHQLL